MRALLLLGAILMATNIQAIPLDLRWPHRNDGQYGPGSKQLEFLNCAAREQLGGGAKRGGKGVIGSAKAILLSVLFPGNRGLIGRQSFTDLRDSTMVTFFQLCPPELILDHNKSEHHIILRTTDPRHPSEIIYRGLGEQSQTTAKAKDKAKSIDLGWFWLDEGSESSFDAYRQLLAQLCWRLPGGRRPPYMALITSNPEPGWVKDRFVDREHKDYIIDSEEPQKAAFIQFLPRDNPGLPPDWEETLRSSMDEDWVKRYLDGSWDIHEGQVFPELTERIHNLDNWVSDEMLKSWVSGLRLIEGMDHGSTGITADVLMGFDSMENSFAIEEYYEKDKLISEHTVGIRALTDKYGAPQFRLIDPSTESKTLQNRDEKYSVQDAYIREGIVTLSAFRSEIGVGLDLMKQLFKANPLHLHPFVEQRGSARLYVSKKRCPNLWRELIALKKVIKSDGTIVYVGSDHAVDCVRYVLMSRPKAATMKQIDIQHLPTLQQIAVRASDKFSETFGRNMNESSFF